MRCISVVLPQPAMPMTWGYRRDGRQGARAAQEACGKPIAPRRAGASGGAYRAQNSRDDAATV
jgi:hypothetical protein